MDGTSTQYTKSVFRRTDNYHDFIVNHPSIHQFLFSPFYVSTLVVTIGCEHDIDNIDSFKSLFLASF